MLSLFRNINFCITFHAMKIAPKILYTVKCIFYFGVVSLKCEENEPNKLNQCSIFLNCLYELGIPIDILYEMGPQALSYTEKERLRICQQLAIGEMPSINVSAFDEDTLYVLMKFINKMVM